MFISSQLGGKVFNPFESKTLPKQKSLLLNTRIKSMFINSKNITKHETAVKILNISDDFDFMVLGSKKRI